MKSFVQKCWPILAIFFLWVLFCFPYFAKGLVPFPSDYLVSFFPPWSASYGMPVKNNAMPDVITQIYPWKMLTVNTWKSGEVPLWNPYSFSGTPQAGNYQSAVFSPFNLLFFILPFTDAWSLLILLQPLLAGLCMYVFVRSLDRSKAASLLAAAAFMFCGFEVVWMAYGTLGYAALFLPLIFFGIHGLTHTPSRWHGPAISIGTALSLLAGHFQVSIYVIAASLLYTVWLGFSGKSRKRVTLPFCFVIAGILIAAPQILLGIRSFLSSTRGASVLKGDIIPWQYLLTFIAPDFYGNPVTRNDWFGHYAEWAGFIGVAPFMLAFFAMVRKKSAEVWFFIILAGAAICFALPTPLNDLLYLFKIPVLSGSAASRIIILTSFALVTLSAYGLDSLIEAWQSRHTGQVILFAASCLGILAVIWMTLLFVKPLPTDKLTIALHNFVMPSVFVVLAAAGMVSGLVRHKWIHSAAIGALVLVAALDVFRFASKWMPFEPRSYVYPPVQSLTYLQTTGGYNRVFGNIGAGEVGTQFHIPLVEGYDAVYQARYGEFMGAVSRGYVYPGSRSVVQFDKNGLYKTEALQLLGIKYIYHSLSDGRNVWVFPFWEYLDAGSMHRVYGDDKFEIFQYNNVFPRAFLASSYAVVAGDTNIVNTLFAKDFDRRNSLVLEEKPPAAPQSGSGSAEITSYTPDAVTIRTDSVAPKLLFLSDVYDTGWRAFVDEKEVRVYRADYDFRAVSLNAGRHTVVFRYEPVEFRWGIMLSVAGAGVMLWLAVRKKV